MSSPTAALLWAACRPQPPVRDIAVAIDAGADVHAAAEIAIAERLSPLLWRALGAASVATDDEEWATILRADARRCHAQSRLVLPHIGRLALAPLAAVGLQPLVFKGAALADRYPDPGLRPMDDVDLIVPAQQIDAAVAALTAAGWKRLPSPPLRRHEMDLAHPSLPGLHIDLHSALATWRTRANHLTSEQLWAARAPTTLYDAPAFVLASEPELVMLAAHAAKPFHTFDRLIWTADIAMVVHAAEASGGLDWDQVAHLADAARCRTALAVALSQAAHAGVETPAELRHIHGSSRRLAALAPVLSPEWPVTKRDRDLRTTLKYALIDEPSARFTLVLSEILAKNVRDVPWRAAWLAKRRVRRSWRRVRDRFGESGPGGEQVRDRVQP